MRFKRFFLVYKGLPRDVFVLFAANIINRMGCFIVPLMTLILTQKIGLTKAQAGIFATVSLLAQMPFIMLGGRLTDRIGSKRTIVIFSFMGAALYFVCALFPMRLPIAMLAMLSSCLYAASYPAFRTIIAEVAGADKLKQAYSLSYLGINLGFTVGPIFAGLLFAKHLNLLFVLDAFSTVLSTALVLAYVHPKPIPERPVDAQAGPEGAGGFWAFLRRNPAFVAFTTAMLVYEFCYMQWNFLLPLQMTDLFSEGGVQMFSMLVSVNALTVILFTPVTTSLTQKQRPLTTVLTAGGVYIVSFAAFTLCRVPIHFVLAVAAMTVGEVLNATNMNCYIAQHTPQQFIGRANSMASIMMQTGSALGPAVMGNVLTAVPFPYVWLIVSAVMAIGAFGVFLLRRADKAAAAAKVPQCE